MQPQTEANSKPPIQQKMLEAGEQVFPPEVKPLREKKSKLDLLVERFYDKKTLEKIGFRNRQDNRRLLALVRRQYREEQRQLLRIMGWWHAPTAHQMTIKQRRPIVKELVPVEVLVDSNGRNE